MRVHMITASTDIIMFIVYFKSRRAYIFFVYYFKNLLNITKNMNDMIHNDLRCQISFLLTMELNELVAFERY